MSPLVRRILVPTLLYGACATWVVAYLRLLIEPAPAWPAPIAAMVVIAVVAWLLRLIGSRPVRVVGTVVMGVLGVLLILGQRADAWPWRDDVRGADGYLGPGGYLDQLTDAVRSTGTAWVRVIFPADAVGEPDAVVGVRLITLTLLICCASGLLVFRVPLLAVFAAAGAATLSTLFINPDRIVLHGLGLCVLGVIVLASMAGGEQPARGRAAVAAAASVGLVLLAVALAAVPGVAPGGVLDWERWTFSDAESVNVGFVWDQQLTALDFGEEAVPVLEVNDPRIDYLRVGVLERFDGFRWQAAQRPLSTSGNETIDLPDELVAPALRSDRLPVERVEVRNLAVVTRDLPLPADAIGISGLAADVRPVTLASGGSVVLAADLPVGATYAVDVADRALTPALLDADVLGAPTDPRQAVLEELASLNLGGRHTDPDGPGPWNADRTEEPADRPIAAGSTESDSRLVRPLSRPEPADLTLDGAAYPAFGEPGRERVVQRMLDGPIDGDTTTIPVIYGWREAYAEARRVTAEAETPYQAAVLLENWFQKEFAYDETASYGATSVFGPLPAFLRSEQRAGHCQYFAGSMTVLLRMLGIPARVAFGFAQGQLDGGRRVVTNRDAHAWVEVRFPYAGWVSFEPTPSRQLATPTSSTSAAFGTSDIALPGGSLAGLAETEGGTLPNGAGPNRGATESSAAALPLGADAPSPWPRRLLILLGIGLGAVLLGAAVWLAKALRRWRARQTDDPRRGAIAAHAEIAGWLDDQGISTEGATIDDVGRRAATAFAVPTERWVEAVVVARYGPPLAARASLQTARTETRQLTRLLRGRATRRERMRGALRPRRLLDR
jgi:transglutaminase-like putative cysteine protease